MGQGGGPGALGHIEAKLAELKVICTVETYYPRARARARNKKRVEKRASLIPGEYKRPLADLDTRYQSVEKGQTGRLGPLCTGWRGLATSPPGGGRLARGEQGSA